MKHTLILAAVLITCTGFATADDAKKPAPETKPATEARNAEVTAGDYTFKAGAPWEVRKEPKMMSAGGFTRPGKDGKAGVEADFYHFGPQGGGDTEANVARWVSQFQPGEDGAKPEAKREEITLGGKKVLLVHLKGTFMSGGAMAAKKTPIPGYAMTGAIIPGDGGSVYVKIIGPEAAITAAKEDIQKLIGSAFPAAK